jgi:putative spermidine/putrescine transport system substrate-binding protein
MHPNRPRCDRGSRQWILFICTVLLFMAGSCKRSTQPEATQPVKIVSWGGKFQQDMQMYWWKSAQAASGLAFEAQSWDGAYGTLTSRISKGINDWDIVHVEAHYVQNPIAPMLFSTLSSSTPLLLPENLRNNFAVPVLQYGYVMAYRADLVRAGHPTDWKDFWNSRQFPGRRALRDFPLGNIEIALLSLGKNLDRDLYSKDLSALQVEQQVEVALDRLNELKPSIVWWSTGDQLERAIVTGDTPMAAAWSGRVWSAFRDLCGGQSSRDTCAVKAEPQTSIVSTDWWVIPANAPHLDTARKFLDSMYQPSVLKKASEFSRLQGYLTPKADLSAVDPVEQYFLQLGSSENENHPKIDERFWGQYFDQIQRRWEAWRTR